MKSVKFLMACQYFLYFAVIGVYLPYFNLYCYHLNFSGFQIGLLASARTLATALFPMLWGALADRFLIRRPIFIFCSCVSAMIWALYLLTTDFTAMLIIAAFYGLFYAPLISFLESFSMDLLGLEKTRYGQLRAWGSFGFIVIVIAVGQIIDAVSIEIVIMLIFLGSLIQAYCSTKIPPIDIPKETPHSSRAEVLFNRRMVIFLICAFLMVASHGTYYGFFSIHLEKLGYSATFIGLAWALASITEFFIMLASRNLFERFSYEKVLLFSFLIAGCRWMIMSIALSATLILFSQILHAITYGAFHMSCILYMDRMTPPSAKTLGQAANNAVMYGFGMMAGFLLNGYYFDIIGAQKLFAISGVLAFMGGMVLFFNRSSITRN